jgi:hypothetical protein
MLNLSFKLKHFILINLSLYLTHLSHFNYHIYIVYINGLIISVFLIINSLINTEKHKKIFLIIISFEVAP